MKNVDHQILAMAEADRSGVMLGLVFFMLYGAAVGGVIGFLIGRASCGG